MADALSDLGRMEVYWDGKLKGLWYIDTMDGITNKYVFRVNEKIKANGQKITVNSFVTAGIIDKSTLKMIELIKIK